MLFKSVPLETLKTLQNTNTVCRTLADKETIAWTHDHTCCHWNTMVFWSRLSGPESQTKQSLSQLSFFWINAVFLGLWFLKEINMYMYKGERKCWPWLFTSDWRDARHCYCLCQFHQRGWQGSKLQGTSLLAPASWVVLWSQNLHQREGVFPMVIFELFYYGALLCTSKPVIGSWDSHKVTGCSGHLTLKKEEKFVVVNQAMKLS